MAAVEVTINGILYDKLSKSARNVALIGEAYLTGLGVGGGPIIPPDQPPSGLPPGIWGGGNVPMPNPPIGNLPGYPNWPTFPDAPKPPDSGGGPTIPGHPISGGMVGLYALYWSPATGAVWLPVPSKPTTPEEPPVTEPTP